jgi:glycosyltransferase involved in cell wall biosynthesis
MQTARNISADLAISNNSSNHLSRTKAPMKAVWQHNRTSLSRVWKHGELLTLFTIRPHLVCLSNDALAQTPAWMPYRSRHVIPHGIEPGFLDSTICNQTNRPARAIFASRASRNLKWLVECWEQYIHPAMPDAELQICLPPSSTLPFNPEKLAQSGIRFLGSLTKDDLAQAMSNARVLSYPGHVNETGCQVALQAIGTGTPIVTCGFGSLKELVMEDQTGFIETDMRTYANRLLKCLQDDQLWQRLHNSTLQHPWRKSWDQTASAWLDAFGFAHK